MRKLGLLGILALMTFLLVGSAYAITTIDKPAAGEGMTGSQVFEITVSDNTTANVTLYYRNTTTQAWQWLNNSENVSVQTAYTVTFPYTTAKFIDGPILLNVTSELSGGAFESDSVRTHDADNTVPGTTYGSETPANQLVIDVDDGLANLSVTTSADPSYKNCTVSTVPAINGTKGFFVAVSNERCSYAIVQIPEGTYNYNISATDGLNDSVFTAREVTFDISGKGGVVPEELVPVKAPVKGLSTLTIAIIIVAVWLLFQGRKKK